MFYLAVVLEKVQIVDRSLDPENEAEFVVELDRNRPHGVFDPCPFDADIETVAHLTFELRAQLAPEESGDIVWLDGINRHARQIFVDRLQIALLFVRLPEEIGWGTFDLQTCIPVVRL